MLNEVGDLYAKMLDGDKEYKLYLLTQLINGYDALSNDKLPKAISRYNGKTSDHVRHFRPAYHQPVKNFKPFNQVINF
jgi:hypothetical protein